MRKPQPIDVITIALLAIIALCLSGCVSGGYRAAAERATERDEARLAELRAAGRGDGWEAQHRLKQIKERADK
jgi:hypothetical protein